MLEIIRTTSFIPFCQRSGLTESGLTEVDVFKVLLILFTILLNKATEDLLRYTDQKFEMTG